MAWRTNSGGNCEDLALDSTNVGSGKLVASMAGEGSGRGRSLTPGLPIWYRCIEARLGVGVSDLKK